MNLRRWAMAAAGVLAALAMSGFAAPAPSAPAGARPSLSPLRTPTPVGGAPDAASPPPAESPPPGESAPPVEDVVPAIPPEQVGGGGTAWVVLSAAVVTAMLAAGFLIWQRRRGGSGPAWTPAYANAPAPSGAGVSGGPAPAGPPPVAAGERELAEVLRRLASGGVSAAISQQIERLLSRPDPGRDALVQAAVHYRDQLAGSGWEHELLTALTAAGVREIRPADGEVFDGRAHEAVDAVAAPAPEYHDRIVQTVRCGYLDHDRVLRPPRVVVYRADGPA
ncbi:hypothetical protein Ait01nite_036000 [Actinoplanes italicus]|uniref:GrpE protein n=1 Tax=Actinoplanes italicus TaxID=113567 RepID=A0A2T0K8N0_9ACTN|nr:nucleotide exchange factor GrpE [Actinoplanes italicus]PRX19430.1 GrpE protein [Actinoplanes italicus]GIE30555.1 hypothetical protein Ait01nite_036000 [Actinoplanes italicus]